MDQETRIRQLERELREMADRVAHLENLAQLDARPDPVEPAPPPVVYEAPVPVPAPTPVPQPQLVPLPASPRPEQKPASAEDIEYKFGVNGLLRGGAAVIVCALLFLTAVLISRGLVTPTVQMGGEIVLCLAFIGVGIWRRNDGEDFGQLLVGIGTVGLYASFAAAYAQKKLIPAETMIWLFLLLSLLALGFSAWRASKSFFILGLIGGFIAAFMPNNRSNEFAASALHFAVLLPWIWVAFRQNWGDQFILLFVSSSAAIGITATYFEDPAWRLGLPLLSAFISLGVPALKLRRSEDPGLPILFGIGAGLTGLMLLLLDPGKNSPYFAGALAAFLAGISFLFEPKSKTRDQLQGWAIGVFAVLGPINQDREISVIAYAVESLILAVVSIVRRRSTESALGVMALAISGYVYTVTPDHLYARVLPLSLGLESTLLGIMMLATLGHMVALSRLPYYIDLATFVGSTALVAMIGRLITIHFVHTGSMLTFNEAAALAIAIGSVVSAFIQFRRQVPGFAAFSIVATGLQTAFILGRRPELGKEWLTVGLILASSLSLALLSSRLIQWHRLWAVPIFALASGLFLRLSQIAALHEVGGFNMISVLYAGVVVLALVWSAILVRLRTVELAIVAWTAVVLGTFLYLVGAPGFLPAWTHPTFGVGLLISLSLTFGGSPENKNEGGGGPWLFVVGLWTLLTHLLHPYLLLEPFGFSSQVAVTVLWVVCAVTLIVLGFRFNLRFLRYGSLTIFAVSLFKVFLVDLVGLDSLVRAAILMVLGLGMLGGGYWYTVWRRRSVAGSSRSPIEVPDQENLKSEI